MWNGGVPVLGDSTINANANGTGNIASGDGCGLFIDGMVTASDVEGTNCTFSDNSPDEIYDTYHRPDDSIRRVIGDDTSLRYAIRGR